MTAWNDSSTAAPLPNFAEIVNRLKRIPADHTMQAAQWVVVAFAAENHARKSKGLRRLSWERFTKLMLEQRDKLILGNVCFDAAMKYGR